MKPVDLRDLIRAIVLLLGLAIVVGRYDDLSKFARAEATCLLVNKNRPPFFPKHHLPSWRSSK